MQLPGPLADAVATSCGWQVRQADVLAGVPETDLWVVAGRSDTREDRIEVRRTWLRGASTGRWAMILSFAAYRQALDTSLVVGEAFSADLHRYPGSSWRALVGVRHADGAEALPVAPPAGSVVDACAAVGEALAAEPWLDRVPATVAAAPTLVDGRWVLVRRHRCGRPGTRGTWASPTLLAASLGQPVDVTVEWTVDGAVPLTVHLPDRALDIGPRADLSFVSGGVITEHWHELVTTSLLGTDRRDPPAPPEGPLADVVDDALEPTPSSRMLTAVAACVAARRAGLLPKLARCAAGAARCRPTSARPTRCVPAVVVDHVATWTVLEDEWLQLVGRRGRRPPADVLVGLLTRHRRDDARRARVVRLGGPVVPWLLEHQPALRAPRTRGARRRTPVTSCRHSPVAPELVGLLDAGPRPVVRAMLAGLRDGTFNPTHRPVLINFIARARVDTLQPLATALSTAEVPPAVAGLAQTLAGLAATRAAMLEELA